MASNDNNEKDGEKISAFAQKHGVDEVTAERFLCHFEQNASAMVENMKTWRSYNNADVIIKVALMKFRWNKCIR